MVQVTIASGKVGEPTKYNIPISSVRIGGIDYSVSEFQRLNRAGVFGGRGGVFQTPQQAQQAEQQRQAEQSARKAVVSRQSVVFQPQGIKSDLPNASIAGVSVPDAASFSSTQISRQVREISQQTGANPLQVALGIENIKNLAKEAATAKMLQSEQSKLQQAAKTLQDTKQVLESKQDLTDADVANYQGQIDNFNKDKADFQGKVQKNQEEFARLGRLADKGLLAPQAGALAKAKIENVGLQKQGEFLGIQAMELTRRGFLAEEKVKAQNLKAIALVIEEEKANRQARGIGVSGGASKEEPLFFEGPKGPLEFVASTIFGTPKRVEDVIKAEPKTGIKGTPLDLAFQASKPIVAGLEATAGTVAITAGGVFERTFPKGVSVGISFGKAPPKFVSEGKYLLDLPVVKEFLAPAVRSVVSSKGIFLSQKSAPTIAFIAPLVLEPIARAGISKAAKFDLGVFKKEAKFLPPTQAEAFERIGLETGRPLKSLQEVREIFAKVQKPATQTELAGILKEIERPKPFIVTKPLPASIAARKFGEIDLPKARPIFPKEPIENFAAIVKKGEKPIIVLRFPELGEKGALGPQRFRERQIQIFKPKFLEPITIQAQRFRTARVVKLSDVLKRFEIKEKTALFPKEFQFPKALYFSQSKAKLLEATKTGASLKSGTLNVSGLKTRTALQVGLGSRIATSLRPRLASGTRIAEATAASLKTRTSLASQTAEATALKPKSVLATQTRTAELLNIKTRPRELTRSKTRTGFGLPLPPQLKSIQQERRRVPAFNAFVKDEPFPQAKYIKVTKNPLDFESAKERGLKVADETISQTVELRKAGGRVFPQSRPLFSLDSKFSKRGNKYIEKRGFAIDTFGEKEKLKVSAFLAREKKNKFSFGFSKVSIGGKKKRKRR